MVLGVLSTRLKCWGMTGINGVIGALRMRLTRQPMNRIILEQAG